eukprot:TRINITY_DN3467_c0_g1_i1.p1 TRINITY_DN3467_c0_g1~~TRINITY_DN3467_c0_g1_i1.p1  ORF type:complete len:425 (+),score=42.42 TRINITY_DN3467_c0_g1_i1:60-1334(+)
MQVQVHRNFRLDTEGGYLQVRKADQLKVLYEGKDGAGEKDWVFAEKVVNNRYVEAPKGWVPSCILEKDGVNSQHCVAVTAGTKVVLNEGTLLSLAGDAVSLGDGRSLLPVNCIGETWLMVDDQVARDLASRPRAMTFQNALAVNIRKYCYETVGPRKSDAEESKANAALREEVDRLRKQLTQAMAYSAEPVWQYDYCGAMGGSSGLYAYGASHYGQSYGYQDHSYVADSAGREESAEAWINQNGAESTGDQNDLIENQLQLEDETLDAGSPSDPNHTTVMLKNIPNKYTRDQLILQLNKEFSTCYDYLYVPFDIKNRCNMGYCFINFKSVEARQRFTCTFHGVPVRQVLPGINSSKATQVTEARLQGLDSNVRKMKQSPVMHQLQEHPEWLPVVFDDEGRDTVVEPEGDVGSIKRRGRRRADKP